MQDEKKVEQKKEERSITITDKGIDIKGEWTVGEIIRIADILRENVMRLKINGGT